MMNTLLDLINQVCANILMFLMGDARLEASTVMTAICGVSVFVGFLALMWFIRPRPEAPPPPPAPPTTTVIVQQSTSPLLMVFVMVMMFGLGLIIAVVR